VRHCCEEESGKKKKRKKVVGTVEQWSGCEKDYATRSDHHYCCYDERRKTLDVGVVWFSCVVAVVVFGGEEREREKEEEEGEEKE